MEDIYNIRKGLAELVGKVSDDEDNETENLDIQLTANDITGSLGVWGIAH